MGIILWIIFGSLVGWMASMFTGTDSRQGLLFDVVLGVIGAVLGGWLMNLFGQNAVTGFNFYSFIVSLFGAVIFISIVRVFRRV